VGKLKHRVVTLGGQLVEDIQDQFNHAVCLDIHGNEFELTDFHD
jgi:hypothetical protein